MFKLSSIQDNSYQNLFSFSANEGSESDMRRDRKMGRGNMQKILAKNIS